MEEAVLKFEALQKYIPFLERFLVTLKSKADTKEEFAKKYDKADHLLKLLKSGFKSKYKVPFLENIDGVLLGMVDVYKRKANGVKLEKIEPVNSTVKMENDYQSPESPPPMYQEPKNEREPITIPTERRDSNNYFYDVKPSTTRNVDKYDDHNRYDDYKRYNERKHFERSQSRSRSPSYERRYGRDKKKYRRYSPSHSISPSRDRRRSRSRDRRRERSPSHRQSPSHRRSPTHRRSSPSSHQRRSKSPSHRRRDDRKYDRERDYQSSEYGRSDDSKRYVRTEYDLDYKRESNYRHSGSGIKQEIHHRKENRDEPFTSLKRYPNPMSRFASATASTSDRYDSPDNFKRENDRDSDKNRSKPHSTMSRFGAQGLNSVEECDLYRDTIQDESINQMERTTNNMFGVTEYAKNLKKRIEELDFIADLKKKTTDYNDANLEKVIISELEFADDFDELEEATPIPNRTEPQPLIQLRSPNERNTSWNENRYEPRNEIHQNTQNNFGKEVWNSSRNTSWNESQNEFRSDKDDRNDRPSFDRNTENRTDIRVENFNDNQRHPKDSIPKTPAKQPVLSNPFQRQTVPSPVQLHPNQSPSIPNHIEERIALSDKYQRRKRNTGDIDQMSPAIDQNALQQTQQDPRQDPRLRNRPNTCTVTSGASLEQFMSLGNVPPLQPPPTFAQFNPIPDICPLPLPQQQQQQSQQQQRPFLNEAFSHSNQQMHPHHPHMGSTRTGQHMHSPSNNYSPNVGFGPNVAMQSNPRNNPFLQNSNMNQHPHPHQNQRQHNYQHQENRQRETYGEHKRRLAREREEQRKREHVSVSSTTAQNTANEQSKESHQESPTQSPNQTDNSTQLKDAEKEKEKEKTSSCTTAEKSHNKIDNAFRNNNWEALPQSKTGTSFKIPKLNRSNSNPSTARLSTGAKDDTPENNVSTSTKTSKVSKPSTDSSTKDPRLDPKKTGESAKNRKSSSDSKKSNNKKNDTKLPENDQIHADTTIPMETEPTPDDPSTVPQPEKEVIKQIPDDLLKVLQQYAGSKFDVIKNILVQDTVPNDDAVTSSTQPAQNNTQTVDTSDKSTVNQSKSHSAKTPKKQRKNHSNELDRLTADIRENIPDVLNATGRRTCTLNTQKSNEISPAKTTKSAEKPKPSGHKSDDDTQSDNVKPNRIARRRNTTIDSRPHVFIYDDDDTPSENTEQQPLTKRIARRRNSTVRELSPVVIESDDEDEEEKKMEQQEPVRRKPGPKSSKKQEIEVEPTDDQVAQLPMCSVVLETVNVSKEMQRITRSSKRRAEQLNLSNEGSESTVEKEQSVNGDNENDDDDDSSTDPKRPRFEIPNTDKTITTKSKRCHLCNKNFQFLSSHYTNNHDGHEVYSARMSAKNSDNVRRNPPKPATYRGGKYTTYCYYCEKDVAYERTRLIHHFIRHTGEYLRNCTKCGIKLTSSANNKTDDCSHPNEKLTPFVEFEDIFYVYMCNLCNYTQYQEENMKNHIRNMHHINVAISDQYNRINLVSNLVGTIRGRTNPRLQSVSTSESESVANSEELANQDVFKPSNQDDDVLSDSFKLMKENTFDHLNTVKPTTTTTSIADRLQERFKQQQEKQKHTDAVVKQETVDTHEIIYRSPEEIAKCVRKSTANEAVPPNPLADGDAVEDGCKIELNKPEANTSGNQQVDADDADDWESCSGEDEDEEEDASPQKSLNNSLNRLLMIKQKANKGRMRSKKRGDKSILPSLKKEKPDEVIDLDKEIKTEKSPEKTPDAPARYIEPDHKRVDNIAYSECKKTSVRQQKFNCFIGNCDFLSVNNPKSLSNHLRQRHGRERWNGNCYACEKQIMNLGNYSLMKEFDHMMDFHVPNDNPAPKQLVKVPEPPKQSVETATEPAESQRPPVIRIRRLSGDKLSGGIEQPAQSVGLQSQPQQQSAILTISSVSSMPGTQHQFDDASDEPAMESDNHLKPWTNQENTKGARAKLKLKRECSLMALFKCMANDCIFTTSDKDKMLEHLSNHEDFIVQQASYGKNHSIQDHSSWLECCYCEETEGSCSMLVDHIINEHSTSIFQCPYCFYRSVDRQNVGSHLRQYHSQEDGFILVCGTETKDLNNEITDLVRVQGDRVKMIKCPETMCKETFVHLLDLNQHTRTVHSDKKEYTCTICHLTIMGTFPHSDFDPKHLHEHGFSLCHCAYCSYHSSNTTSMHTHLRDEHPTKLPYSFVRIRNDSPNTDRQPSIVYFGDDDHKYSLVCSPLTEAQLNFMNPSLSESVFNSGDPPSDDDSRLSIAAVNKDQFNNARKVDRFETEQARQQYYIKSIDSLTTNSKTPMNIINVFNATRKSTSVNAIPSVSNENVVPTDLDAMMQREIDYTATTLLNGTGIENSKLYRCAFEDCTWVRSDEREFLMHLSQHDGSKIYTCFHCRNSYPLPVELKNHVKEHMRHRFFCFYCNVTTRTQQLMDDHFATSHQNQETHYLPLNPHKYELSIDIFVACPDNTQALNDFIRRLASRVLEQQANKRIYLPGEGASLPQINVFPHEIQCGKCGYSNKVRVNLLRHFKNGCTEQQHAPVNPVPCLNSNERHFDKMKNLAASSNSSDIEFGIGKFIPEEKRFVCGAKSCKYQTVSANMLQQHIVTLHDSEKSFGCPHCGEDLNNSTSAIEILNHLRYHDSRIFKCPNCSFIHYLKLQVDRHIVEKHPNVKERAITLNRPMKKVEPVKVAVKPVTYRWSCNICLKIFNTKQLVKAHLSVAHRLSYQFKCAICSYANDTKTAIKEHLTAIHNENDAQKIKSNFDRVESEADNSPIWRRDDPTRVKHIRGILFDDSEKSSGSKAKAQSNTKKQSIHLEIKPIQFLKPTNTATVTAPNKTPKLSQDDSAVTYKLASIEPLTNNKTIQQKFGVVARSTSNEMDRFVIVPPKESVEEEVRPRPASLRQQPKRRFSTYIPSAFESQPSTSTAQPPISLRLKRISDPVSDEQKMPPPKAIKLVPLKKVDKVDLSSLNLIYVCNYCQFQSDTFDKIHAHWLSNHKKGDNNDPIAKRFCYRVTQMVKCILCSANLTYQTIRTHMEQAHPNCQYAFCKYSGEVIDKIQCGICGINAPDVSTLQNHFRINHPQSKRSDMKIEPLPILDDATLEALLQQGDSGTFKCTYCCKHFPCRYDYEQHHNEEHGSNRQRYEINGKDVIKYGCHYCRDIYTDENMAIIHLRSHIQQWFQCMHCTKKVQYIKLIETHLQLMHDGKDFGYRLVNARENLNLFYQMTLTFSNGLALIWGDLLNTKYGGADRLIKYINELNEEQRRKQESALGTVSRSTTSSPALTDAGKVCRRRQTLL